MISDSAGRSPDSLWSNSSGGWGMASGRVTGLAVGGGALYIGGAAGGVFRSLDGGVNWVPLTDGLPTLSVGDLRLVHRAAHSLRRLRLRVRIEIDHGSSSANASTARAASSPWWRFSPTRASAWS